MLFKALGNLTNMFIVHISLQRLATDVITRRGFLMIQTPIPRGVNGET